MPKLLIVELTFKSINFKEKGDKMNLDQYWDVENKDPEFGQVLTQEEFFAFFDSPTKK
jgi:hypothetical protein